jgi:hypothetical protein
MVGLQFRLPAADAVRAGAFYDSGARNRIVLLESSKSGQRVIC